MFCDTADVDKCEGNMPSSKIIFCPYRYKICCHKMRSKVSPDFFKNIFNANDPGYLSSKNPPTYLNFFNHKTIKNSLLLNLAQTVKFTTFKNVKNLIKFFFKYSNWKFLQSNFGLILNLQRQL